MAFYNGITVHSKSAIKRFAHGKRFMIGAELCKDCASILDYGTGSAYFLKILSEQNPTAQLVGYEPIVEMYQEARAETKDCHKIRIVNNLSGLNEFDCVTCFEVLEHLVEEDQIKVLTECTKRVRHGGRLIISVPIETGISGLFKNIIRWIVGQEHTSKVSDILNSFLGIRISRETRDGYIYTHTGFVYSDLEKVFAKEKLEIKKRFGSPFRTLGTLANSQLFYTFDISRWQED